MSDSRHENESGLIIDPALLAQIQAHCGKIAAELEATGQLQRLPVASGSTSDDFPALPAPPPISESERFAAAVSEMPPRVRAFFALEIRSPRTEGSQTRLGWSAKGERVGVDGAASFLTIPRMAWNSVSLARLWLL
jgi:hypothetical protein